MTDKELIEWLGWNAARYDELTLATTYGAGPQEDIDNFASMRDKHKAAAERLRSLVEENEALGANIEAAHDIANRIGLDQFDAAADRWLQIVTVRRMIQAITSVFASHTSDDIMTRFQQKVIDTVHLAFVEGAAAGTQAEVSRLSARVRELEGGIKEAIEMVGAWGSYAGDYFREKHGLDDDIAALRSLLQDEGGQTVASHNLVCGDADRGAATGQVKP